LPVLIPWRARWKNGKSRAVLVVASDGTDRQPELIEKASRRKNSYSSVNEKTALF